MHSRLVLTALLGLLIPFTVHADVVVISTGVNTTIPKILEGLVNIGLMWSGFVATALFLLGSIMMVGSGGSDQLLSAGKRIMKAALIGLAIILSSWMILSTAVYFIAG